MPFDLLFTKESLSQLRALESDTSFKNSGKLKKVRKCLAFLENNPKHPGLRTQVYVSFLGENGEKIWEAYVDNNTSFAWRILWHYGPKANQITIISILAHPN